MKPFVRLFHVFAFALAMSGCMGTTLSQPESDSQVGGLLSQGRQEFNHGALASADKTFSEAIRVKPDLAEVWNSRGFVKAH